MLLKNGDVGNKKYSSVFEAKRCNVLLEKYNALLVISLLSVMDLITKTLGNCAEIPSKTTKTSNFLTI